MTPFDFTAWQQLECARLGISVEEHNKLLEVSWKISACGAGNGMYDYICNAISINYDLPHKLGLPQKHKHLRKYLPKKQRRIRR